MRNVYPFHPSPHESFAMTVYVFPLQGGPGGEVAGVEVLGKGRYMGRWRVEEDDGKGEKEWRTVWREG